MKKVFVCQVYFEREILAASQVFCCRTSIYICLRTKCVEAKKSIAVCVVYCPCASLQLIDEISDITSI
jgi:hypothetical protein